MRELCALAAPFQRLACDAPEYLVLAVDERRRGYRCPGGGVSPLGLWVEPEDAQFLVAPTGLGDTRRPRDGLVARRQFQHREAAIERGRPRIAAHCNRAVS